MKVKIFGKPNCVFCNRAKHLVTTKPGIQSTYIDMEEEGIDKEMLIELCGKPVSTIPQIFVDGEHIGGYTELVPIIQKYVPRGTEEFDPNMDYFVREIGEGDYYKTSFEAYLAAIPTPHLDYKKEPKTVDVAELGTI